MKVDCVFNTEYLTVCEGKDRIIMSKHRRIGFEVEDGSRSAYAYVRVRTPALAGWSGRRHMFMSIAAFTFIAIDEHIGCSR